MKSNLKPIRTSERAKKLGRRGGLSKSPRKALASRINGLIANKELKPDQRYMLSLLKERRFIDVITELISMNLEDISNPSRRDKIIDQLTKFVPQQNFHLNFDANGKTVLKETYVRLRSAVMEVCSQEQFMRICEIISDDNMIGSLRKDKIIERLLKEDE
jgi:hypothetical protein